MPTQPSPLPLIPTQPLNCQLIPLQLGLLAVRGPDAVKFLQGQVTCDVKELENNQTRLGAHCNPKGRMLASFRALQVSPDEIWLLLPSDQIEAARTSLGKYIVFSKASLVDLGDHWRLWGLCGADAGAELIHHFRQLPPEIGSWCAGEGFWIVKVEAERFLLGLASKAEGLSQLLAERAELVSDNYWTLLDIASGLGEVRAASRELFTPQSLNFQLVNGISFRKGCYTGQEIVARLHYRGALKRHMYRFALEAEEPTTHLLPSPGQRVVNSDGQHIGELVIAAFSGAHQLELLANVAEDQCENAFLLWPESDPVPKKLGLLPLPYAIPKADKP